MYDPREDSFLILKHIKQYARPNRKVLDLGTGSSILAKEAAKFAGSVTAADIDKKLISRLKKQNTNKNKKNQIKFMQSDLFSNIKNRFDLIIFNPPYLPSSPSEKVKDIKDIALDGGKNGTEIIKKFLMQAKKFLEKNGKILMICSSLNKDIEKLFERRGYKYKKLDQQNFFFEKILLYELS